MVRVRQLSSSAPDWGSCTWRLGLICLPVMPGGAEQRVGARCCSTSFVSFGVLV